MECIELSSQRRDFVKCRGECEKNALGGNNIRNSYIISCFVHKRPAGALTSIVFYLSLLISKPLGNNRETITILVGQKTSCWQIALVFHSWYTVCGPFPYLLQMKAEDPPKVRTSSVSSHDLKSAGHARILLFYITLSHQVLLAQLSTPGNPSGFFSWSYIWLITLYFSMLLLFLY